MFFVESSGTCLCPCCQSQLKHRDYRKRIKKLEGGKREYIYVERQKCSNRGCGKIHTLLPSELVPYKHYASEVVAGVLDGIIHPDDTETEDHPCETTMERWHVWLAKNHTRIDGYLKSIGHRLLGLGSELMSSGVSLLEFLKKANIYWLEIIISAIYNSGGYLVP